MIRTALTILIIIGSISYSYTQFEDVLSSNKYIKDLDKFMSLIDVHPESYRQNNPSAFDSLYNESINMIDSEFTSLEFYKQLCKIAALIKDGHTNAIMPSQWLEAARKENGILPFKFHLSNDNKLFITESFNEENSKLKGVEVISINGTEILNIVESLDPYISYERLPFRNVKIQDRFEVYLYMVFGSLENLIFKCKSIKEFDHKVVLMPLKDAKKHIKQNRDERDNLMAKRKPYSFEKISEDIGLLSIYSFSTNDINQYKVILIDVFKKIKKNNINHLILDVRENLGGWPKISSLLFHFLTEKSFKTMAYSETKVSEEYKNNLQNRYKRYGAVFLNAHQNQHSIPFRKIVTEPTGSTIVTDNFYIENSETRTDEYSGHLYLLTDRKSYSASSCFAATFNCYQMGTIIGEETGGTNIFYANTLYNALQNSGIGFRVSTVKDYTACFDIDNPDDGIKPNIPFSPSFIDEINDFDSQLNFTKMIIKKVKKQEAAISN